MIKSTPNQHDYTKLFITKIGLNIDEFERYSKEWWWNHTNLTNLRLSNYGFKVINSGNTDYYIIELPEPLKNRTLIQMSRLLTCPYYIKNLDLIYLLGEEETVMIKLHADNLQQYLDNMQL